ncbi:unnamed protein product [Paramecium pentaurelia]|uniref:Uncharacterized protein n=1 Tax=Paramecium pentaurelia TaxID=43138 RepID=A0A8S1YKU4_9CILI|nr:unnamed protein product [Paramecium pentaurelia]
MSNLIEYINLDLRASVLIPLGKKYLRTKEIALKSTESQNLRIYLTSLLQGNEKSQRMWELEECQKSFSIINSLEYQSINGRGYYLQKYKYTITTNIKIKYILEKEFYLLIRIINRQSENNNNGTFVDKIIKRKSFKNTQKSYLFKVTQQKIFEYKREITQSFDNIFKQYPILYGYKKEDIQQQNNEYYIDWNQEKLQDLLIIDEFVISKDWLNDYFMPQNYLKLFHIFNSVKHKLFIDSRVGEFSELILFQIKTKSFGSLNAREALTFQLRQKKAKKNLISQFLI